MMNETDWQVGMKVVCVDDRFHPGVREWGDQLPEMGQIYTIRQVSWCRDGVTGIYGVGLKVEELRNPGDRLAFSTWHFEPLQYEEEQVVGLCNANTCENSCHFLQNA